jgi:hypothetical protein
VHAFGSNSCAEEALLLSEVWMLSEAQICRIEPYFPLSNGIPRVDDRRIVSGIIFVIRNGWVPRQYSSGGKERLGRISKAGQADIRQMLIIGAISRLNWMGRKSIPEASWLERIMARKPRMPVAIALANKMARQI